jgi:hypothetical protein
MLKLVDIKMLAWADSHLHSRSDCFLTTDAYRAEHKKNTGQLVQSFHPNRAQTLGHKTEEVGTKTTTKCNYWHTVNFLWIRWEINCTEFSWELNWDMLMHARTHTRAHTHTHTLSLTHTHTHIYIFIYPYTSQVASSFQV